MVHNPPLTPVRALRETRVTDTIGFLRWVLVEYTACCVLVPAVDVHRVVADKLDEAKTVVPVVGSGGRVYDEGLVRVGIGQLLWSLV